MHDSLRQRLLPPLIAAVVAALVAPLATPSIARADDSSGIGVARLSVVDGDVAIARGDSNTTVAAAVNAPLLGADYLTTGDGARAEVQFDGNTALRVGSNAQVRLSHIDNGNRAIQLAEGTVDLRLLRGTDGTTSIDTPSISVVPRESGSYRVSVDEHGTTFVTVRSGAADIALPAGSQRLGAGSTLVADGAASDPHVDYRDAVAYDSFDAFNRDRDRVELDTVAERGWVDDGIGGVAELNDYGRWVDDGSYGHVWIPNNVATGWAPYRNGNWVWEDGYGWTWVAAEPWGWAPYHYGRWYFSTAYHSWCWYPPARAVAVPAWSPALVGFVGFTIGAVSVGVGFGHIGWVPLAPYEPLHPWWGSHPTTIINNVYVNKNVYVNNTTVYRNLQYNAMTGVSVDNFRAGRFNQATVVTREQFEQSRPVALRGALPVVPTASNLRFTQRERADVPVRSVAFTNRSFAGTPAVAPRTPFAEQQTNVERLTHAPAATAPVRTPEFTQPENRAPSYARPESTVRAPQAQRAPEEQRAPETRTAPERPAYAAPAARNDAWGRFNGGRGYQAAPHAATPAEQRPAYQRPQEQQPAYQRPQAQQPSYQRPQEQQPTYARPQYQRPQEQPQYQRPQAQQPQQPQYERPQYQRPSYQQPQYQRPQTQQPQYQRPQYQQQRAPQEAPRGTPAAHDAGSARGDAPREHRERG